MSLSFVQSWKPAKEIPEGIAYLNSDTGNYECKNHQCWLERASIIECGGQDEYGYYWTRPTDELSERERGLFTKYTPILRCTGCGRVYFGYLTPTPKGEPVIRKTAEERITELEERIARLEEALASVINNRERPAISAKGHREQSPKQEDEYIILPSIMTV